MDDSSPLKTVYSRRQTNSSDENESSSASSSKKSRMSVTPGHKTDKLTKNDYGKQFHFRQLRKMVPRDVNHVSPSDESTSVDDSFSDMQNIPFSPSTPNKSAKESEDILKSMRIDANEKSNTPFQFESENSFGAPRRLSESLQHELGGEDETF